ncbi:MAG: phenylalanine--tRNA ligase subunit alpha [Acidimicrobiia bacterium]|nr:phenylalanine--tRNA ligase subunit alpha [Acidimicrobiia bacterium]MBT8213765.1 phenylalanine--tRNA ligase subunit alpha [Acidimicrobiia bacterium]NNF69973.1 phenylalanine--tRNA ligase subunit alpha [Acidimicrobiia bacterium]NNK91235.1 phenylalanine--tRNA ligase subunit alpha [Acidimicrobiia bacterium]
MAESDALTSLVTDAGRAIDAAATLDELSDVESTLMGKESAIAAARRGLKDLPADERRDAGRAINEVAETITESIRERRLVLSAAEQDAALAADRVDITQPARVPRRGTHHLVSEVLDEIIDIFASIGYRVARGPEAETDYYNFTALNIPQTHPARLETDTLYLDYRGVGEERTAGDERYPLAHAPNEVLLRTHTSPMQARYMEANDPPVHIVVPGRVFRNEALDPTHSPVFHQVEGLAVDDGITFADLKGTLAYFARQFFGPKQEVRFLPNHFPFTEPSAEMHVSCFSCGGSGCRICSQTGWIEMLGCGMVHPAVLEHVGYDPATVTGFAFGIGADRFAMVRHGITDLRHFFESDLRVLRQFS